MPTFVPRIPDDVVHLDIEVDRSYCGTPHAVLDKRLTDLEHDGLDVPVARIVAYAAAFFQGSTRDVHNVGLHRAQIIRVWEQLQHWNPRAELRRSRNHYKLVLDNHPNPGDRSFVTELLGVGVGLYVAKQLYQVPLRHWHPTNQGRFDYVAPTTHSGQVSVEVRARFNRTNWLGAVDQVHTKLDSTAVGRAIDRASGILFAPRTTTDTRSSDVLIIDPEGAGSEPSQIGILLNARCCGTTRTSWRRSV